MKASPARLAALVATALTLGACDIAPPGSGVDDAGSDVDAGADTVEDQCTTKITALCNYSISSCGNQAAFADCIAQQMPLCCTGSACSEISESSAATLATCTSAIAVEDCSLVGQAMYPPECQGVPQIP
jgi:hypothetical protein